MSETETRQRLAAILMADVAGYSRLMSSDERGTVAALDSARALFRTTIGAHRGRVIDMAGDSVLAIFETASGAVASALAVQAELGRRSAEVAADARMEFRIGVHLGDVIEKSDGTIYGDSVNIAARLESIAEPGGVTVSDAVQCAIRERTSATFEDIGEQRVKNIAAPVRIYRIRNHLRFGATELQIDRRLLLQHGEPVALGARAFDVLVALAQRRDRVVAKSELLDLVWPGTVAEENNLQVQISSLRKLLGPHAITTVPGRGYRFTHPLANGAGDDGVTTAPVPDPAAPAAAAPAATTNLPRQLPPLYGRDADLLALSPLLDQHRLISIVGAGGIGKSRLAQAVTHAQAGRLPDGAWMVELAGLVDPALLPNAVAQPLGIALVGPVPALDVLVHALAERSLLLVLDNCEHLLDAVAALVQAILAGAPNVTVLTTSQEPLRLPAEQQYRLLPLALPGDATASDARDYGAVVLFEARVRAANPRFTLNEKSLPMVVDICRRLDGLPLALELAAARVATLGLQPVRDKLDERFKLLTGGSRATLRRHQTLRAALEWSHNLLNDGEKAVFRRLGMFAGGFTMESAQAVAGDDRLDEWTVLEHLSALVEKSLVVADAGDAPRYRLLESARAFALELLAEGETAATLERHAWTMRRFLERADHANFAGELPTDQFAALVLSELDNLRAAHEWAIGPGGDREVAIALAGHAGSLIDYAPECIDWLIALQPEVEGGAAAPAVTARYWRAIAAKNMTGHVLRTLQVEAAVRALAFYRAAGDAQSIFACLMHLARHRNAQRDVAAARAAADEARALLRPQWPVECRIFLLRVDAQLAEYDGRLADVVAISEELVRISTATGDWRLEVSARVQQIDLIWKTGALADAARAAVELAEELRVRPAAGSERAMQLANTIGILSEMGRVEEASAFACEAIPVMRRARTTYIEQWVYLFWRRGQLETAALLLGACDAERARFGTPHQENERRLIAEARAALAAELPAAALANALAAGALLQDSDRLTVIAEALAHHP